MWVYNFPPIWKNFSHSKKYIFMAPLGGLHLLYINPISSLEVWMLSILHEGNSLFNVLNYSLSSRMRHGTNGKKVISILLAQTYSLVNLVSSGLTSEKHITLDQCSLLATTKRKLWVPSESLDCCCGCHPVCLLLSSSPELVHNFSFSASCTDIFVQSSHNSHIRYVFYFL